MLFRIAELLFIFFRFSIVVCFEPATKQVAGSKQNTIKKRKKCQVVKVHNGILVVVENI